MRLLTSRAHAEEVLTQLAAEGYAIATWLQQDYSAKQADGSFDSTVDNKLYEQRVNEWGRRAEEALLGIFPSGLEVGALAHVDTGEPLTIGGDTDKGWRYKLYRMRSWARKLEQILKEDLPKYTDLPVGEQLFIEDIDSFQKARDINPRQVQGFLTNGRLEVLEDEVQVSFERILGESFHKKDHGGEESDLFSTFLKVNGQRVPTAFLLKGRGLKKPELTIADCGKNGDQIVRLLQSPAELFVIQYVGVVSENVIKDIAGKVRELRAAGRSARFCIINGTDTARIMLAHGDLDPASPRAART